MIPTHRPPTHSGEMLVEQFPQPMNLTQNLRNAWHLYHAKRELSQAV